MASDHLVLARNALAERQVDHAVELIWKQVRPAVLAQNDPQLAACASLADEAAAMSQGSLRAEAEKLGAYCRACIVRPRADNPSVFSTSRLFGLGRSNRKKCPECAERIAIDAKVCRFCGYRYTASSAT